MKWLFEISDQPESLAFPVIGTQHFDNGVKKGPFYFSMADFIIALKNEPDQRYDEDTDLEKSTPALPLGTIRYSANNTGEKQRVTLEIPKKKWQIRYGDETDKFYTIGFPRMVVQFLTSSLMRDKKSKIDDIFIYAVLDNKRPITDTTELYSFPYTNVWKDSGRVCWGSNERLTINELVELERMFNWFISAPFNEELGVKTIHGIPNFKYLIEQIEDQDFEDDWLLPDVNKRTFEELCTKNKRV